MNSKVLYDIQTASQLLLYLSLIRDWRLSVKAKYLVCFGKKKMYIVVEIDHCLEISKEPVVKVLPNPVKCETDESRGGKLSYLT